MMPTEKRGSVSQTIQLSMLRTAGMHWIAKRGKRLWNAIQRVWEGQCFFALSCMITRVREKRLRWIFEVELCQRYKKQNVVHSHSWVTAKQDAIENTANQNRKRQRKLRMTRNSNWNRSNTKVTHWLSENSVIGIDLSQKWTDTLPTKAKIVKSASRKNVVCIHYKFTGAFIYIRQTFFSG